MSKFRDRVLDKARINEGDVVLDLGCGDGLKRDLVAWSEAAGFAEVHLTLRIDLGPTEPVDNWVARENSSGNPLAPTLREAIEASLTPDEAERFRRHLRAEAEAGRGLERGAVAYLWARKAGAITA